VVVISNFDSLEAAPSNLTALGSCLVCLGLNSPLVSSKQTRYEVRNSIAGVTACYGKEDSSFQSMWGWDFPNQSSLLENGYWLSFSTVKRPEGDAENPLPSSTEVKQGQNSISSASNGMLQCDFYLNLYL